MMHVTDHDREVAERWLERVREQLERKPKRHLRVVDDGEADGE